MSLFGYCGYVQVSMMDGFVEISVFALAMSVLDVLLLMHFTVLV